MHKRTSVIVAPQAAPVVAPMVQVPPREDSNGGGDRSKLDGNDRADLDMGTVSKKFNFIVYLCVFKILQIVGPRLKAIDPLLLSLD